jgi:hypothetical protein
MAFSDAAIGFYLQMSDEMTPQFPGVLSAYQKFVRKMEALNEQLYESTAGTTSHLGALVKGLTKIAKSASMKLDLSLTPKSRKSFIKLIGDAVTEALAGSRIRLRAAMPAKLSKLFSTDVALRQLYQQMPQPPDMIGGIQRFAEGGKVPENKGKRGKDSVLGLLTPGEVVIPTDLVAKLEAAFETVGDRKGVIEAGFGTKQDVLFYNKALMEIAGAMDALANATKNAGIEAKTRLTPQIVNLRQRFTDLTKVEQEAGEEADHLLGKILGPARFVAIMTSLRGLQDGFSTLSSGVQQFSGEIGTGEFQSFPDRLREIRQRLGLSAEEAVKFTGAVAESSETLGTNFFKALEATDALIGAGEKDRTKLIEQSALLSRANRVTGADFDSLAKSMRLYTGDLKGSTKNFDAFVLSIDQMTKSSDLAVNTPELMEALTASLNNPILKGQGQDAILNYANNLLAVRAAAESVFAGDQGLENLFADAARGVPEALTTIGQLTQMSVDEIRTSLLSKGGLVGVFDKMAVQLSSMDPTALPQLGESIGIDGKLLARFSEFAEKQRQASGLAVPFEDSATAGDKLSVSMDKMTSAAEKLSNVVGNFVGSSGPMQTMIEFLDQVPVLALIAGAHLSGTLLKSFGAFGKGALGIVGGLFGGIGKATGGLFGKLGGAVGGKVGGMLSKAGGFFGGLFGKLGGLVTGILGVGGAAGGAAGGAGALAGGAGAAVTGPGLLAVGGKIALVVGAIGAVLLLIGSQSDKLLPILEQTLPGLMRLGKFVAEEVAIGISDTLVSLGNIFAPLAPMTPTFEQAGAGMWAASKMLGAFALVGVELAALGTGAMIADGIGKILDLFGAKSPMEALREQATSVVDTLLYLTTDLVRLTPVAERVPKLQVGLDGSAKFMTALKPLLDQTAELGDAAANLGDGWFTSGPLSNLRTQAEPMIDTITDLSTWFTRVPINQKAIAGVDFAAMFFSKLAVTVAAMQQVGAVDAGAIRNAANALLDVRLSQPSTTPSVSKEQIDQIMQVVVQAGEASPLHRDLQETNTLLRELISAVKGSAATSTASLPTRVQAPTTRVLDGMVRDLTELRR